MRTGKHVLSFDNWYFLKPERCILGTDDVADGICLRNRTPFKPGEPAARSPPL